MRFAMAIVIACSGCKALLGIDDGVVGRPDAGMDASSDANDDAALLDAAGCYGPSPYEVCVPVTNAMLVINDLTAIDTTACASGQVDAHGWCVISAHAIRIDGEVTFTGTRPIVLLGRDSVTISNDGLVDGSSRLDSLGPMGSTTGPAANPTICTTSSGGTQAIGGGGGGAGGTLGTSGGTGGFGNNGSTPRGIPGLVVGGETGLRGGCKGGRGGTPSGPAGDGGGAVYLLSAGMVEVRGGINASGAPGGAGMASKGGGSGGGSGGVIFLAAPAIRIEGATIWANGGGGGGGADNGANGSPGSVSSSANIVGMGGAPGSSLAGRGGNGATGVTAAQDGGNDMTGAGGGGGGGGVGVIRAFGTVTNLGSAISPPLAPP